MSGAVRIVVVEDNQADVLLLKETLRQMPGDFTLERFANGEDAAKAIAAMTDCPDLFLLDINIPRVNGLELLKMIRAHAVAARVPVAMFTSSHSPQDRAEAERLGADDYIVKPPSFFDFVNQVGSAIRRLLERPAPGVVAPTLARRVPCQHATMRSRFQSAIGSATRTQSLPGLFRLSRTTLAGMRTERSREASFFFPSISVR